MQAKECYCGNNDNGRDGLALRGLALEQREQRVYNEDNGHEVPHVEAHRLEALCRLCRKLVSEICQRQAVLVESHPEENHHGEYQTQSYDTLLGLFLRQLFDGSSVSGCCLLLATLRMTECRTEHIIDGNRQNQRSTCHSKREVISVVRRIAQCRLSIFFNLDGCRRCKQCTDIDGHVENGESRVALVGILWIVIQVAHHHLEVAFEQSRAETD